MQEKIHPNYGQTTITCACGNVIEINRSLLIQAAVLTVSRSASVWRNNENELKAVHRYRLT